MQDMLSGATLSSSPHFYTIPLTRGSLCTTRCLPAGRSSSSCTRNFHLTSRSPRPAPSSSPHVPWAHSHPADRAGVAPRPREAEQYKRAAQSHRAPYRRALNRGQLAGCQHAIQTPAKASLAAINPSGLQNRSEISENTARLR